MTVTDTKDGPGDNKKFLGDVPDDQFKITHANSLNGNDYNFISVANVGNTTGFIAEDGGHYYFITNANANGAISQQLNLDPGFAVHLCFMEGTRVLAPEGEIAVEDLRNGNLVTTTDGRLVPVRWIGRQTVASLFADELRLPNEVRQEPLAIMFPAVTCCFRRIMRCSSTGCWLTPALLLMVRQLRANATSSQYLPTITSRLMITR